MVSSEKITPQLSAELQRKSADEPDRTLGEILKTLEEVRNRIVGSKMR